MKSFWMSTKRRAVFIFMRVCEVGVNEKLGAKVAVHTVFPSSGARDVTSRGWGHPIFCRERLLTEVIRPLFCFGGADTPPRLYIFEGRCTVTGSDRLFISKRPTEMRFM